MSKIPVPAIIRFTLLLTLGMAGCGPAPSVPHLALDSCCALVVGEKSLIPEPSLLISQRRGLPTDDVWTVLGEHHRPQPPASTDEFRCRYFS